MSEHANSQKHAQQPNEAMNNLKYVHAEFKLD